MPTNLPPEYFAAEARYRAAETTEEKIAALEELLGTIPKHKGTDKLRADFRQRLSKLKEAAQIHKRAGKQMSVFHIDREGAGQVVVVGPTNVGKSALVAALTKATPEVAAYPYTTWSPTPGMMPLANIQIQLIDTPPLTREHVEPELLALIRRADLLLVVVDLQGNPIQQLEETLAILAEHRILPRQRQEGDADQPRVTFLPLLVVVNKNDDARSDEDVEILQELLGAEWPLLPVSVTTGRNLERLKQVIFERLDIIRVYSKPPGQEPDFGTPFVLRKGGTVEELAGKIHQDFLAKLKSARVWGTAVYDGQMVGRDHILHDGDVVELRL
jgi:ribosome-interacting GTPase 1